jgi:LysM domain
MSRGRIVAVARLIAWTALLLVLGRVTLALGSGSLAIPLTSLHDLRRWTDETDPADMAAALVRLLALAVIAYLLAATVLTVVADLVRARGLTALSRRVTPALVRRLATGGGGLGLALGTVVGTAPTPDLPGRAPPGPAALVAPEQPSATMTRLDHAPADSATMTRIGDLPPDTATMRRDEPLAAHTLPGPAPPSGFARASGDAGGSTWTVAPGDSFWSIAEELVTPAGGPAPTERQVARYWRRLIDANRGRLADPGNPDLLLPGQRLLLPPPDT